MATHVSTVRFTGTMTVTGPTNNTCTITNVDWGTEADRCAVVIFEWPENRFPTLTAIAAGAVSGAYATGTGTNFPTSTNEAGGVGIIFAPPSGTANLVFTGDSADAGNGTFIGTITILSGVNTGQSTPAAQTNTGTSAGSTNSILNVSSASGHHVVAQHMLISSDASYGTTAVSGFTARATPTTASGGIAQLIGDATGAGTVATDADWDDVGTTEYLAMGVSLEDAAAPGGLSIPIAEYHYQHHLGA